MTDLDIFQRRAADIDDALGSCGDTVCLLAGFQPVVPYNGGSHLTWRQKAISNCPTPGKKV